MCPPWPSPSPVMAHYRSALRAAEVHSTLAFSGDREGSSGGRSENWVTCIINLSNWWPLAPLQPPSLAGAALSIISTVLTLFDHTSFLPPMWSLVNNPEIAEKSFIDIYYISIYFIPLYIRWKRVALGAKPTLSVQYCDDPQLTSVSELSEQKLGLVTLTTCRLISAAALRKNTRTQTAARGARGRCRRQKVRRTFTFSSMFSLSLAAK